MHGHWMYEMLMFSIFFQVIYTNPHSYNTQKSGLSTPPLTTRGIFEVNHEIAATGSGSRGAIQY